MHRYDLVGKLREVSYVKEMEPADEGEWMRFDEAEALRQENIDLRADKVFWSLMTHTERAEQAEEQLAALHAQLRQVVEQWRASLHRYESGSHHLSCDGAGTLSACAKEIAALLAATETT